MKASLFLCLFFAAAASGAHAQSTKPAVAPAQTATAAPADDWSTPPAAAPATPTATDPAATPVSENASGLEEALGAEPPRPANVNSPVKPLGVTPKLNPNSSGTYDKKVVKNQNKRSEKAVMKRRRATARYAEVRRNDQYRGVRRMEHGKTSTMSMQR